MAIQQGLPHWDGQREPIGFEQITSLGSAVGFSNCPARTRLAFIQAEGQDVRWRDDGTNPTASVGVLITVDSILSYTGNMSKIKFIEATAGAVLNISYYA